MARLRVALTAAIVGLSAGGCSMSYQFDSLFSKSSDGDSETTGSIKPAAVELPPEADLTFARRAALDVLSRGSKDASQSWENPRSGAHGTVTPLGSDYRSQDLVCRDFLASHVKAEKEAWMQGEACRKGADKTAKWDIRSLKPWRRT